MARQERFLGKTIENVLENIEEDTEIIAILDGYWPNPPIHDHPRVTIVHVTEPIGQRGACNLGARLSQSKYIMKLDAHCAVDKGFDRKLIEDCQPDWVLVPACYRLHAFDWECKCGVRTYQGAKPVRCKKCGSTEFKIVMVWEPRWTKGYNISYRFDKELHFQYWRKHKKRKDAWLTDDLIETMSFNGPCMFMERDLYWELGGCDEEHGFWGQFGTEWACKAWLSGGKLVGTKKTWFAHMFRTGNFKGAFNGGGCFPYHLSLAEQERAKVYSQTLWRSGKWEKARYSLDWLVERFRPVPGWHDDRT